MKKSTFFLFAFIILISAKSFSQCDSLRIAKGFYNSYSNYDLDEIIRYSPTGKIISNVTLKREENEFNWNDYYVEDYQYDSNDSLIFKIQKYIDYTLTAWGTKYSVEQSFDASGNKLIMVMRDSSLNTGHISFADTFAYDVQSRLISEINYQNYYNSKKKNYSYNGNGQQASQIFQNWNGSTWIDTFRYDFYYNASGDTLINYKLTYNSSSWDSTLRTYFHYNSNSLVDTIYTQKDSSGIWINSKMEVFEYGTLNRLIYHSYLDWENANWDFQMRYVTEVDSFGYPSLTDQQASYSGTWGSYYGPLYSVYDSTGHLLNTSQEYTDGGSHKASYTYTNGILTSEGHSSETHSGESHGWGIYYYYAELNGNNINCQVDSSILSVDSCSGDTFLWSTGETTSTITVSTRGDYQATITRANGWVVQTPPVHIYFSSGLPVFPAGSDSTLYICYGVYVDLEVPYEPDVLYDWYRNGNQINWQSYYNTYTVRSAGSYYLIKTNSCGSDTSATTQFIAGTTPSSPIITSSGPVSFCDGGSVTLTCSPGNYFSWLPGNETSQSIVADSNCTYSVTVTNTTGCTASSSITVNENLYFPSASISFASGSLKTNPNPPIIQWYKDGVAISNGQQSNYYPTLPGNYYYTAGYNTSCLIYSDTVYIDPSILNIYAGSDKYVCDGGNVIIGNSNPYIGGTPPYTYSWSPTTDLQDLGFGTARIENANSSRTYTLTITDSNGNNASDQVNVNVYHAVPAQFIGGQPCYPHIQLNDPYARGIKWINNGDTTNTTSTDFYLYYSTVYSLVYADSTGCILTTEQDTFISPERKPNPHIFATLDSGYCLNGIGTFWIHPEPGSTYEWKFGSTVFSTDTIIQTSNPNMYTVVSETDSNGCVHSSNFVLNQQNQISSFSINQLTYRDCDSNIIEAPSITGASYTWYLNLVALNDTDNIIQTDSSGNYLCEMIIPGGCTSYSNYTYSTPTSLSCTIDSSGTLLFQSGIPVLYSYFQWYRDGIAIPGANSETYNAVSPGNYSLRLDVYPNCLSYSNEIYISACAVNINENINLVCDGVCNGRLDAFATGTPPFQYLWSTGDTTQTINNLCAETYIVWMTDSINCISSDTTTVYTDSVLVHSDVRPTNCIGCNDGSILLTISNFVWNRSISITPTAGTISGDSIINLPPGIYQLCVEDGIGCTTCISDTIQEDPTGIIKIQNRRIFVYPNPTSGIINISSPDNFNSLSFTLCNILGEKIINGKISNSATINISDLAKGLYFLYLNGDINKVIHVVKE